MSEEVALAIYGAVERLTVWLRDYGDKKEPWFVDDVGIVVKGAKEHARHIIRFFEDYRIQNAEIARCHQEIERLQLQIRTDGHLSCEEELELTKREKESMEQEIGRLQERNAHLQFSHNTMTTRYTQLEEEVKRLQNIQEELEELVSATESDRNASHREIGRLRFRINQLETECWHREADLAEARQENEQLHHEISYYESLSNDDPNADWPHRDGRYRDWLMGKLKAARAAGWDNEAM